MGHLRNCRLNPTQVPTVPVEIDWGHPLAFGLVGCWLLNGDFRDYGPFGFNGTPNGGVGIAGTPRGPAASFNGTNQFVSTGLYAPFNGTGNQTIAAWVTPASTSARYMIASNDSSTARTFVFSLNQDTGGNLVAGAIMFEIYDGAVGIGQYTSASFAAGEFAFLCAQRTTPTTVALFKDGVLLSPTGTLNQGSPSPNSAVGMCIGQRPLAGQNDYLNGSAGGVSVWNYATPADLLAWAYAEPYAAFRPRIRRTWFVPAPTGLAVSSAFVFINENLSVVVAVSSEQSESLSQAKSSKQGNIESLSNTRAVTMAGHDALSRNSAAFSPLTENTGSVDSPDSPYLDSSGANTSVNTLGDASLDWLAPVSSAESSASTEGLGSDSTSGKFPASADSSLDSVESSVAESGSNARSQQGAPSESLDESAGHDESLADSNLSVQASEGAAVLESLGSVASEASPYVDTTGTNDTVETLGNAPLSWLASVLDSSLSRLETAAAYSSAHQQLAESQGLVTSPASVRTAATSALALDSAAMSSILSGVVGDSALSQECLGILHTTLSAIVGVISTLTLVADSPPLESLRSFSASAGIADSETLGALRQNLHVLAESAGANNLVIGADSIALEALSNAIADAAAFVDTLRGPAAPAPGRILEVAAVKRMLSVAISLRKLTVEE